MKYCILLGIDFAFYGWAHFVVDDLHDEDGGEVLRMQTLRLVTTSKSHFDGSDGAGVYLTNNER